jgi:hypothetical protein
MFPKREGDERWVDDISPKNENEVIKHENRFPK